MYACAIDQVRDQGLDLDPMLKLLRDDYGTSSKESKIQVHYLQLCYTSTYRHTDFTARGLRV